MSQFSNRIKVALEQMGISQTQLSELSGVPNSQVNKYARGVYRPSLDVLEKLCQALPEEHRAEVVAAHLCDEIPPCAKDSVCVEVLNPSESSARNRPIPKLRKELVQMFEFFQQAAVEDEEVADWLLSSYRLMRE